MNHELSPIVIPDQMKPMIDGIRTVLHTPVCELGGMFVERVPMRDGVELVTQVCVPKGEGPWPCLFTRPSYPTLFKLGAIMNAPWVEQGYAVVIQACRGTAGSGGEWQPFDNERNDGIDALKWLAAQPWMDGRIATFGNSYMSYTQWVCADEMPKEVKTMLIEAYGIDRYAQVYMNGMFRHDIYTSWALTNSGEPEGTDYTDMYDKALEIRPHKTIDEKLLGRKLAFYQNYISKIERKEPYWKDSFWETLHQIPAKINVPVCVIGGWFDHHLDGTLAGYNALRPEIKAQSRLVVGPWDHLSSSPGERSYPDADKFGRGKALIQQAWLDRIIHGKSTDQPLNSEIYIVGEGKWKTIRQWPVQSVPCVYYPNADFTLTEGAGKADSLRYLYDPANPVETIGGSALLAWTTKLGHTLHGARLQPDYKDRNDVLVFKSQPFEASATIVGASEVELEVSTTAPDTAFMVKLSEELSDGQTFNIVDGTSSILLRNESDEVLSYTPGEKVKLKVKLWDTAWQIQPSSKLRLDITSSNFPMYHIHPNKAGVWSAFEDWDTAEQTVYFGDGATSIKIPFAIE